MVECLITAWGQPYQDFPPVFLFRYALYQASQFQTVHQFYGAVVMDEKARGEFTDSGSHAVRKSCDSQHKLMLLGFNALLSGCAFAEKVELPDLPAEFSKVLVLDCRR